MKIPPGFDFEPKTVPKFNFFSQVQLQIGSYGAISPTLYYSKSEIFILPWEGKRTKRQATLIFRTNDSHSWFTSMGFTL